MTSRRVLQVVTRSEWGGAQRIVESLATSIDGVTAVACGPGGRLIDRLERSGVSVHVQPHLQSAPHPRDFLAYRDLKSLIDTGNFDLVHCHSTKAGALARIAASRAGVPSVFTVHGWGFYNSGYGAIEPLITTGERLLARRTDAVVCVSHNDCRVGRQKRVLTPEQGTVIHNGIEPPEPSPDRTTLHEEFDIDPDTPVIGAVARLAPQKDPLAILDTARRLADRGHDVATVLIGSGPLAEDCRSFVSDHDMQNVYLPGFRDDAMDLLFDFDVFLLPSRFEGFPLTVLECLHVGVPVVAHDVGGVSEAIDDGSTGFVVSPERSRSTLADRVEILLTDPQRHERMGQRARQVAAARFTEQQMVKQYRTLYESILA